jgi:hypothetical protein
MNLLSIPDEQLPEDPPFALLTAARAAVPVWLTMCVRRVAEAQGLEMVSLEESTLTMVERTATETLSRLAALLGTDVDEQRANPLDILRSAVGGPTAVLRAAGAQPVARDRFAEERFPNDVFDLTPATWADIDESLAEPGLTWGAWKAAVVLTRRRDEGLR